MKGRPAAPQSRRRRSGARPTEEVWSRRANLNRDSAGWLAGTSFDCRRVAGTCHRSPLTNRPDRKRGRVVVLVHGDPAGHVVGAGLSRPGDRLAGEITYAKQFQRSGAGWSSSPEFHRRTDQFCRPSSSVAAAAGTCGRAIEVLELGAAIGRRGLGSCSVRSRWPSACCRWPTVVQITRQPWVVEAANRLMRAPTLATKRDTAVRCYLFANYHSGLD